MNIRFFTGRRSLRPQVPNPSYVPFEVLKLPTVTKIYSSLSRRGKGYTIKHEVKCAFQIYFPDQKKQSSTTC